MDFNFEWLNPQIGAPIVSIAQYGLTFSKGAVAIMGEPEFIMLGFDSEKKVIGAKVCDQMENRKIEFASRKRDGYVRINNKDFISILERDTNLDFSSTIRFTGKWNGDGQLLIIDLEHPKGGNEKEDADEDESEDDEVENE